MTHVASVLASDPTRPIPAPVVTELVVLARGGLQLSRVAAPRTRVGPFHQAGARAFRDVHHGDRAVVIDLRDPSYDRSAVEVEDPVTAVAVRTDALSARGTGQLPADGGRDRDGS